MEIKLREATSGDNDFLFLLYASTRRDEFAALAWPREQLDAFLRMQFRAQSQSYAATWPAAEHSIILDDGRPVGRLLVGAGDSELCLIDIALVPDARGRGIGSMLIDALKHRCRDTERALVLHVARSNPLARALYLRLGFISTGGDAMYESMVWRPPMVK